MCAPKISPDDEEELSSSTKMLLELLKLDHDTLRKDGTCSLLAILLNETDGNCWKLMTKSTYKTLLIKLLDNRFICKVIFIYLGTLPHQQHSTSLMVILNALLNHKSLQDDNDTTSKLQTLVKV